MSEKKRLTNLARQVAQPVKAPAKAEDAVELIANKPHGEKTDHIKITVTIPPEVYKLISDEAARRKMNKLPNAQLSAVIREAVVAHFGG